MVCFSSVALTYLPVVTLLLSAHQEIDEYELVDPVDILTPLEKSGFWDGVVSSFLPHLSVSLATFNFAFYHVESVSAPFPPFNRFNL